MSDLILADVSDCVLWTMAKVGPGYGHAWRDGRHVLIHRWTWEQAHGPLAPGMQVHHLCGQPSCYNLAHLEAISQREHLRRHYEESGPTGAAKVHAAKQACPQGHPYDGLYEGSGRRQRTCSTCHKEAVRRHDAKRRAKVDA